jgi:hypothetical protein
METTCDIEDKLECNEHTKNMHAQMEFERTQAILTAAHALVTTAPSMVNQKAETFARYNWVKARIIYASFDKGGAETSAQFKVATGDEKKRIAAIIVHAKKERALRDEREIIEAERKERYEVIKANVKAETTEAENDPQYGWVYGYNKAIAELLARSGKVVYADAVDKEDEYSGRYYYGGRYDSTATKHLKKCGALQAKEVHDQTYDEFMDTYADTEDEANYCVRGKLTCNCGYLVEDYVEVQGNFSDMVREIV